MRAGLTLAFFAGALGVSAQSTVSLILPFDPQPLAADIAGVDSAGRTTYVVVRGSDTTGPEDGFFGTATLVQGPSAASFTYEYTAPEATVTLGYDCALSGGTAVCTGVDPESGETEVVTETSLPLLPVTIRSNLVTSSTSAAGSPQITTGPSSSRTDTTGPANPTTSQQSSARAERPYLTLASMVVAALSSAVFLL